MKRQHPNVTTDKCLSRKNKHTHKKQTDFIQRLTCNTSSFESLIMVLLANTQLCCEKLMK